MTPQRDRARPEETPTPVTDSLATYRAKRSADRSPEPVGTVSVIPGRLFVVHKHDASHLHFDLRLELSRAYEENGDLDNALKQSDAAITIDANRPEGHANAARLLYLASEQVPSKDTQAQLVAQALAGFNQAIAVDPNYPDAYFFRAVLYAATNELARSQVDLQNYLVKAPAGEWASQARDLLTKVSTALEAPSTTVPPTTTAPRSTKKK